MTKLLPGSQPLQHRHPSLNLFSDTDTEHTQHDSHFSHPRRMDLDVFDSDLDFDSDSAQHDHPTPDSPPRLSQMEMSVELFPSTTGRSTFAAKTPDELLTNTDVLDVDSDEYELEPDQTIFFDSDFDNNLDLDLDLDDSEHGLDFDDGDLKHLDLLPQQQTQDIPPQMDDDMDFLNDPAVDDLFYDDDDIHDTSISSNQATATLFSVSPSSGKPSSFGLSTTTTPLLQDNEWRPLDADDDPSAVFFDIDNSISTPAVTAPHDTTSKPYADTDTDSVPAQCHHTTAIQNFNPFPRPRPILKQPIDDGLGVDKGEDSDDVDGLDLKLFEEQGTAVQASGDDVDVEIMIFEDSDDLQAVTDGDEGSDSGDALNMDTDAENRMDGDDNEKLVHVLGEEAGQEILDLDDV
ncbi:hypothetical protein BT96DRAFT_986738 [Gymnopus androsaceus JB14]|uniref:Uncharacterized protein n=1 Tax=Gymnopus androsaceus JB14 TaxID=1447944 RepID=A0A6A4IF67_9AGAR|nr:hypothetical protein BT96DRAFT_986738 [Gymnopus androsaceus JB14]